MKPQEKNMEFSKTTVTILAAPGNDLNLWKLKTKTNFSLSKLQGKDLESFSRT
jgi:hypothetical protein